MLSIALAAVVACAPGAPFGGAFDPPPTLACLPFRDGAPVVKTTFPETAAARSVRMRLEPRRAASP